MEFPAQKPTRNQDCLVRCDGFSEPGYEVASYDDGKFIREPNGDITEYVIEWIPLEKATDLF